VSDSRPRSRKRAAPSFDVPADVTAGPESGWVFRSEAAPAAPAAPADPAEPVTPPAAPAIVMAPVIQSESPLRFAWVPLAIGYSTVLAMLPRPRRRSGSGQS
jgi:hypothetical protein